METLKTSVSKRPLSLTVALTSICAGLYAIGSFATAYIPSPWGAGQFRPAVVIPSLFAVIAGSFPAGIGAALGTLIADSVKHGRLYEGSLFAAVPGNFLGFYLFGYIVRKRFTWGRFVLASNVTLTLANFVTAALYVLVFKILYLPYIGKPDLKYLAYPSQALVALIIGMTIYWFVTMLPFVLLVTPMLIRAVASAFPSIIPEDVRRNSLKEEIPQRVFSTALSVPGIIMLLIGLMLTFTPMGDQMIGFFGPLTAVLVQGMFYISGGILTVLGLFVRTKNILKRS